jgi:hypothetical protein
MAGCTRKTVSTMLLFFLFHPATAHPQSQKSQIWRVPVLPHEAADEVQDQEIGIIRPDQAFGERFWKRLQAQETGGMTASEWTANQSALTESVHMGRVFAELGLNAVGRESGGWGGARLSVRGHPGREPEATLEGIPLSSGFTGQNTIDLLPLSAISEVKLYPFVAATGLPRRGNSGSFDITLRKGIQEQSGESHLYLSAPVGVVLGQRTSLNCVKKNIPFLGCLQAGWQFTSLRRNSRVTDDRNTPQVESDDTDVRLKYNDLQRSSFSLQNRSSGPSSFQSDTSAVFSAESQGLNGLPVSQASVKNRGQRRFFFLAHALSFHSPDDGRFWLLRAGSRVDRSEIQSDLKNQQQQLRVDKRAENLLTAAAYFSLPLEKWGRHGSVFASATIDAQTFQSEVSLNTPLGMQKAKINSGEQPGATLLKGELSRSDLGTGLQWGNSDVVLLRGELFALFSVSDQKRTCGVFAPQVLCSTVLKRAEEWSPGGAVEIQHRLSRKTLVYFLSGRSMRLPTPLEVAGRPDGVVAHPDLQPERTLYLEGGLQNPFFHAGIFQATDRNLITARQVSPLLLKFDNTAEARRFGAFAQTAVHVSRFHLEAQSEILRSQLIEGQPRQTVIPFIPLWQARLRASSALKDWRVPESLEGWTTAVEWSQTGAYGLDPEGLSWLSPPPLVSWAAEARIPAGAQEWRIGFRVENLGDERLSALRVAGAQKTSVPWVSTPTLPISGRSFEVNLRLLTP